jgi:hypothetical protein
LIRSKAFVRPRSASAALLFVRDLAFGELEPGGKRLGGFAELRGAAIGDGEVSDSGIGVELVRSLLGMRQLSRLPGNAGS